MNPTTIAGGVCDTNLCHQTGIQFGPYSVWLLVIAAALAAVVIAVRASAANTRRRNRRRNRAAAAAAEPGYTPDAAGL